MNTSFLFQNCYTGTDFENLMVKFLGEHGFRAKKTGSNDGGIDIIAQKSCSRLYLYGSSTVFPATVTTAHTTSTF